MATPLYALSIKQPWAALIVHGFKRIEIRRWQSSRRGPIWIHAAAQPDPRPEAWERVPAHLLAETELRGGIIGSANLIACREYRNPEDFAADVPLHLNHPSWFLPPVLYGFEFSDPTPRSFQTYPGWMRFFQVAELAS